MMSIQTGLVLESNLESQWDFLHRLQDLFSTKSCKFSLQIQKNEKVKNPSDFITSVVWKQSYSKAVKNKSPICCQDSFVWYCSLVTALFILTTWAFRIKHPPYSDKHTQLQL